MAAAVAAALILGAGTEPEPAAAGDAAAPNVVVVMTDDQHQASLPVMANVESQLVDKGTTFENNFTNWPLCCPSRATFLTGQYAHNHHVLGNAPPDGGVNALDDSNTLPIWLRASGYHTVHIGKYLNGYGADNDPTYVPPGWDEWYAGAVATQNVYDYSLNQNGTLVQYGEAEADFKQDVFSNLAVDAINRRAPAGPFLLTVMYTAPHSGGPNNPPLGPSDCNNAPKPAPRHATAFDSEPLPQGPSFNEADVSDKPALIQALPSIDSDDFANIQRRYRCRLESLLSVDEGVDRIIDALRASGELDNTLIIYTSDNGFFAGEHRVQSGKNRVYEEAIRVPLVIRGPGVPEGASVDDLAINADLAPTIVDAAGATARLTMDGRSLLPFAAHPSRLHGRALLLEQGNQADPEDEVQGTAYSAVRTARYKYVENRSGEVELYDLESDPFELQNQVANPAYDEVESAMAARLAALRNCSGDSCRATPALTLKLAPPTHQGGASCREPKDLLVRVRGSDAGKLTEVVFRVGSKLSGRDHSGPFRKEIRPRLLRDKRKPEIRAIADLVDGRKLSLQTRVRICR